MTADRETGASNALHAALAAVRGGAVIAVATDTVYGLACDPANAAAVDRVYVIKGRPAGMELSLLAGDAADLDDLVRWTAIAEHLAEAFWPGPLSLVLPIGVRGLAVPRRGGTVSVRVPDHDRLRDLLRESGPLASTSANRHRAPPLTQAAAVRREFGAEIGAVLAGGRPRGSASTIIDCSVTPPRVLRDGPIDSHRLREFVQG
ncbi:MAG: threonylcarbamoyl-AMP synthase [Candidatus Dormibacteraeota bacterium]|nr:threonylcarbamoyl-AMP synthase [Candidatus Dormibacteraeota bacterium]